MRRATTLPGAAGLALAILLGLAPLAEAEFWPTSSTRELATRAELVVMARPGALLPIAAGRTHRAARSQAFYVTEVLRSSASRAAVKVGAKLTVSGLEQYTARSTDGLGEVMLFLTDPTERDKSQGAPDWRLMSSGMRGGDAQGRLRWPMQMSNPGLYSMGGQLRPAVKHPPTWAAYVKRVRADLTVLQPVHTARASKDPAVRAAAALAWLVAHRKDVILTTHAFSHGPLDSNWAPALPGIMDWLVKDGSPAQILQALDIWWTAYQALGANTLPPGAADALRSVEGRAAVFRVAADPQQPKAQRLGALALLASPLLMLQPHRSSQGRALTPDEKAAYMPILVKILGQGGAYRLPAILAIAAVQRSIGGATSLRRFGVLKALATAYGETTDAHERTRLDTILPNLGGARWFERVRAAAPALAPK